MVNGDLLKYGVDETIRGVTRVYAIGNSVLTMNNYDATSKSGVQTASSHISATIYAGNIKLNDGAVTTFGGTVDLSEQKACVIVQGNSSGAKSCEITLLSGFITGDGKNTITNFNFLTTENAQTADRIWTTGEFENINLSGNDVILKLNSSDILRITGAKVKNIQLSENGNLENVRRCIHKRLSKV